MPENGPAADVKDIPETEKKGCNNDEVLAVLAHELGHWKLNHVLKNIIIMQVSNGKIYQTLRRKAAIMNFIQIYFYVIFTEI